MKSIFLLLIILCFGQHKVVRPKPLYLFFPERGEKQIRRFVSSYDRINKKVTAYDSGTVYYFPCKTYKGDYRFASVNHIVQAKPASFLAKPFIKSCDWLERYKGTGLNGYDQQSEFKPIYIVEKLTKSNQITIVEVTPDFSENDYLKNW